MEAAQRPPPSAADGELQSPPYIVVGSGIAGTTLAEELAAIEARRAHPRGVILLAASGRVTHAATRAGGGGGGGGDSLLREVSVHEMPLEDWPAACAREQARGPRAAQAQAPAPALRALHAAAAEVDGSGRRVRLSDGRWLPFYRLCLCAGAAPAAPACGHVRVHSLRDAASSAALAAALAHGGRGGGAAARVVVAGNGGIAMGLAPALAAGLPHSAEVVWAVRDAYVGSTFCDASASAFLLAHGATRTRVAAGGSASAPPPDARSAAAAAAVICSPSVAPAGVLGSSLGPGWEAHVLAAPSGGGASTGADVVLELSCHVAAVIAHDTGDVWQFDTLGSITSRSRVSSTTTSDWPLTVSLSSGRSYGADCLVFATGVQPQGAALVGSTVEWRDARGVAAGAASVDGAALWDMLETAPGGGRPYFTGEDGGLLVDRAMRTTGCADIFAAGDAATVVWPQLARRFGADSSPPSPPMWFQMRLWDQARGQALYTARAMTDTLDELEADDGGLLFDVFAHVTRLLGFRVALLGLYNGQGLGAGYEAALRRMLVVDSGGDSGVGDDDAADVPQPPRALVFASAPCHTGSAAAPVCPAADDAAVQVQVRVTPGVEYAKVVLYDGVVVGAMLIGDTGLDEALENLILNQLPVTLRARPARGAGAGAGAAAPPAAVEVLDLLDPCVELDDIFD